MFTDILRAPDRISYAIDRSAIFLLHIVLEGPLAFQGWWNPASLPFLGLNNTTLVFIKVCAHYLLVASILD